MCIFGGNGDNGAAEARQLENERNARINEGMARIDETFSPFDADYYKNFQAKAYGLTAPDIKRQYRDASNQATYGLARSGTSRSSAAAKLFGDLNERFGQVDLKAMDDARALADQRRSDVESTRSNLVTQLNATANPQAAAQSAVAQARALTAPPVYSPITNAFADFTAQFADAQQQRRAGNRGWGFDLWPSTSTSSRGSQREVR